MSTTGGVQHTTTSSKGIVKVDAVSLHTMIQQSICGSDARKPIEKEDIEVRRQGAHPL